MSDGWRVGGAAALSCHAPDAAVALSEMIRMQPVDLDPVVFASMRAVTAEAVGLTALPGARVVDDAPEEVIAFAEQFAVDVTLVDETMRSEWTAELGQQFVSATQAVYVADFAPRVRAALDALFGEAEWPEEPLLPVEDAWPVIERFVVAAARLPRLDALTTELVRLRCARLHRCRLCMSRRSLAAVEQGAMAETFVSVDDYRASKLDQPVKAALALVDAMIWTPSTPRAQDLAFARRHLTPAQAVEVVLDVARHATNKVAVSLGADAAEDPTRIAFFEVDHDGNMTFP